MNNNITLDYERGRFKDYQKRMIGEMAPEVFIPMSFVSDLSGDSVTYDVSGYISLNDVEETLVSSQLYAYLDRLVGELIFASEYLIYPESISLSKSTIYVKSMTDNNNSDEDVRIFFIPKEVGPRETVNVNLDNFLNEISSGKVTHSLSSYINSTRKLLSQNCSINELQKHISNVRREVYLSGIR